MASYKRFRFQKKYIAFFTIVPLLVVTSLVKINCPVCNGQGFLFSTPGMENVEVRRIESEELEHLRDACGLYLVYHYSILVSLENSGSETAIGYLKLVLIDFTEGQVLDRRYSVVEIPGKTSIDVAYRVWFKAGLDEPLKTEVNALVLRGEVPDLTCDGTGKIPINTWFLANGFRDSGQETGRIEKPFLPPIEEFNPEAHMQ